MWECSTKIAFDTVGAWSEFNVFPFGLTTSPSCFKSMIENAVGGIIGKDFSVCNDDVLVATDIAKKHVCVFRVVLRRLLQNDLKLKATKSV